jgi:hypothetical protein
MNKLNFRKIIRLIFTLLVVLFFCSACNDNDEPKPDYVGKWLTEKPVAVATGFISVKYYIELTENSFTETFIRPSRSSYSNSDQFTLKGSVSASGNTLKLIIHNLSLSNYNFATGTLSAPHETHTYKDQDFGFEFEGMINTISNYQVEYSIVDGKIIFKVDYNRDGIYSESEKSIYTKL